MSTQFTLRVRDLSGNERGDLGKGGVMFGPAFGLRFSTVPAGCGECTVKLPYLGRPGRYQMPDILGYNYRLDVMQGRKYIWSGVIEEPEFTQGTNGLYYTVLARGHCTTLGDQMYTGHAVGGASLDTIASDALTNLAPLITNQSITASGFTLNSAVVNLQDMTAAAVLAWMMRFGTATFEPQQFVVYPDDAGNITGTLGPRPTTPSLEGFAAEFEESRWKLFGQRAYNRASIRYNAGGSWTTRNDTGLQTEWGRIRELRVVLPEITDAGDAQQIGDAMLAEFGTLRMAATVLRTKAGAHSLRLYDSNGAAVRPWDVRAGQLMRFRDVDPSAQPLSNISWSNAFRVAGTVYDEEEQSFELIPESFDNSAEKVQAKVMALLEGRYSLGGTA